jgi:hypothetical protein
MMLGSDSPQSSESPQSPQLPQSYEDIYEVQYGYIRDHKDDDIYWNIIYGDIYEKKYYKRKKYSYLFFLVLIVGMLFAVAVPGMYNIKTKKEFEYWQKIENIVVPNPDYYGSASNTIDPTGLSILWYAFVVVSFSCMLCIYKLKPKY